MTASARDRAGGGFRGQNAAGLVVALAAPALVTLLALTPVSPVLPALLYVVAVCAAAVVGGLAAGLVAAVASFVPFAYFFAAPRHSFSIAHAGDVAAFVVFVLVAVGLSRLVARERAARGREQEARERAEAAAARTLRLEAVARGLSEARTPQQVLDAVLARGLAAAEATAGLIGLVADDGETIEVVAHRGYSGGDERFARWGRFRIDEELPLSEVVRTGNAVYLATTAERDRRYPLLAGLAEDSHALTCLPLVFEGRMLGGLVLSFPRDQQFEPERRALKEALAAQAAQALDRARLDAAEHDLRERFAFLAEASEILATSLDYSQTLRQIADLAVPRLADWCAVDIVGEDGSIERLAVAHQDPAKVRYAEELAERYPPDPDAPTGVPQVLRSGEPQFIPLITDELLVESVTGDQEMLRIVRELGLRSAITVPLIARRRTLGALSLIAAETVKPYTPADLRLAEDLARRAAVAIDNARLHVAAERRADAARALHHVADAVVLIDREGRPRFWNAAADRLLAAGTDRLPDWQRVQTSLADRDPQADPALQVTVPVELAGQERWLNVSRVEFEDGCVYALRDVTEERLLERTRSEFVATASHELRTPIAAVYGTFQTLLRDDITIDRDDQERFLRVGLQESERLNRIIDDLLIAGQLDGGAPTVELATCDLATVVGDVVESAAARVEGSHTLSVSVDPALGPIECDPQRLRQVLANLIENAVKYSPDGGRITVSASPSNGTIAIEVQDEGIGIPERETARIFERFVRLDPALSRGVGGTGLGLYISRELVQRMNGRISVRSHEGEGSTFVVELPARQ